MSLTMLIIGYLPLKTAALTQGGLSAMILHTRYCDCFTSAGHPNFLLSRPLLTLSLKVTFPKQKGTFKEQKVTFKEQDGN
jgi:hypothetical protein